MKKILTILLTAITLAMSCDHHEDIWNELRDHEQRIEQLEKQCRELNTNVQAIQAILNAIQANDYVTEVMKIMEDGVEVGYCLTFAKGGTVTIYHGTDGTAGSAPNIGIKKASDGAYYWTSNGEWLTDDNGNMIPATVSDPDGGYVTPQFRVYEGVWYVSYDNGNSWSVIEPTDEDEDELFQNVTYDQRYVYITLADGSQFKIPYNTDSKVVDLFIFMGQSNMAGRGVAAQAPEVPEGWGYEYKAISDPGKLHHIVEPFGLNEENPNGVDDRSSNGNRRTGTLVSAFTNAYYENTQVPVVAVSCSIGGTATSYWMPGGKALNDAIQRHNDAEEWLIENGYQIRHNFMFWLQGESDATANVTMEKYTSNMKEILKEMINKTGVERCIMIRVGKPSQSAITLADYIIQAQTELCQTYVEFVMGSTLTAGFVEDGLMKDNWHYTQKGYNVLGKDVGTNLAFYVNNNIEPYMYDPHTRSAYYPISKYKSIFDNISAPENVLGECIDPE